MPPYTTSSAGFSATSLSRLFCSIRYGASVSQDLQLSVAPRGARMLREGSRRVDMDGFRWREAEIIGRLSCPGQRAAAARAPVASFHAHIPTGGHRMYTLYT